MDGAFDDAIYLFDSLIDFILWIPSMGEILVLKQVKLLVYETYLNGNCMDYAYTCICYSQPSDYASHTFRV